MGTSTPAQIAICIDGSKPTIARWPQLPLKDCDIPYIRKDISDAQIAEARDKAWDEAIRLFTGLLGGLQPEIRKAVNEALNTTQSEVMAAASDGKREAVGRNHEAAPILQQALDCVRGLRDEWHEQFDKDVSGDHDEKIYYARAAQQIIERLTALGAGGGETNK